MWTRRGQFFLVLREVSLKLSSYLGVENRLEAFSQKGGLPALPPAASSRTWRGCPICCRAIWGPQAALASPSMHSKPWLHFTALHGNDSLFWEGLCLFSNDNAIQTWIGRNVMRLLILMYFQCECSQNILGRQPWHFFCWTDTDLTAYCGFFPQRQLYRKETEESVSHP